MKNGKLKVAVVGLRFGGSFVPIYVKHPDVYAVDLVDIDPEAMKFWQEHLPIEHCWNSLSEALEDASIDAVHLVTPIAAHAAQAVQVLNSGKHCASTVPAAVTLDDLQKIIRAERESGKNYMMMETSVYTFICIKIREMYRHGEFGRIQLLRGCHYQDLEKWPSYWFGFPPMQYATHAIAPLLSIADARAKSVVCFGSGTMREELQKQYSNPYPVETAIFRLTDHPAAMEVTRSLFETARCYCEGFGIYGSKKTFEWFDDHAEKTIQQFSDHLNSYQRGRFVERIKIDFPDTGSMLPPEIGRFTEPGDFDDTNPQKNFKMGGGHHGSHPHLVHEFVRSIIERRKSAIDSIKAAEWTAPGICAHLSAMANGAQVDIPDFR